MQETAKECSTPSQRRRNSDSVLKTTIADEIRRGHEQLCIRRADAVKQRGISLLNEVDAQYSALQVSLVVFYILQLGQDWGCFTERHLKMCDCFFFS